MRSFSKLSFFYPGRKPRHRPTNLEQNAFPPFPLLQRHGRREGKRTKTDQTGHSFLSLSTPPPIVIGLRGIQHSTKKSLQKQKQYSGSPQNLSELLLWQSNLDIPACQFLGKHDSQKRGEEREVTLRQDRTWRKRRERGGQSCLSRRRGRRKRIDGNGAAAAEEERRKERGKSFWLLASQSLPLFPLRRYVRARPEGGDGFMEATTS